MRGDAYQHTGRLPRSRRYSNRGQWFSSDRLSYCPKAALSHLGFAQKQVPDRRRISNKTTLTLTLSRPTGEGIPIPNRDSFQRGWIRRRTEDDSPSPIRWGMCLAWSLRERTERGVYAASATHSPVTLRNSPSARKAQTVKRPEGRAPTPLLCGALNTYPMGEGRGEGQFARKFEVVFARVLTGYSRGSCLIVEKKSWSSFVPAGLEEVAIAADTRTRDSAG